MPSSGPQVNHFPLFQTLSAIRHVDSSAKVVCPRGKELTSRREAQSREPVNKGKKKTFHYFLISCVYEKRIEIGCLNHFASI
jgi:hypothetical protein